MNEENFIRLEFNRIPEKQTMLNSAMFLEELRRRRSVREFSEEMPDGQIVINCISCSKRRKPPAMALCIIERTIGKREN